MDPYFLGHGCPLVTTVSVDEEGDEEGGEESEEDDTDYYADDERVWSDRTGART